MRQSAGITPHRPAGQLASRSAGTPGAPSPGAASADPPSTLAIVQAVWGEVLRQDVVGPDDDFVDLGGNSLMVASTVARLSERVGIDIPPRALFEAPTPAEMAELIDELRAERAARQTAGPTDGVTPFFPGWLIPLQRHGTRRPVFLFPGGRGGVWALKRDSEVAAQVGQEHPFYGFLRDIFHVDRDTPGWLTTTVADYVAQMRAIQPSGPYLLYGVCNGGDLAWEAARQLIAAGQEIASVLMYESAYRPGLSEGNPDGISIAPEHPWWMPPYDPPPLDVDLTLLMTEAWQARGRSDGWRRVTRGRVETVVMPGDTPGMHNLYVGRVSMVAAHLRAWIERSESRIWDGR
jgi:acyl carrier protein